MSPTVPLDSTPSSTSNFRFIFDAAVKAYEKQTKRDLLAHPLASQLQKCDSPASILAVLQSQVDDFDQVRKCDERLTKWLGPTIHVLIAFSDTLAEGVSLVFSPAKVIFAGAGVLLRAAKDVIAAQEALIDIFGRIESFFKRLETYTKVRSSAAMTDIITKIMVEILNILGIVTKEIKKGRTKKYLKRLVGKTDIEDALQRLDKLTQEEVQMAATELLALAQGVNSTVKDIEDTMTVVHDDGKETQSIVRQATRESIVIMQRLDNNVGDLMMNQWRQELRMWFSSPDPSTNHIILCGAQHQGTANWFFRGSLFEEWKFTGSLLWIHGKPGSGKSVLCSAVIKEIMTLRHAGLAIVAYFYFDFKDTDKQNCRNLLLSLLSQLSSRANLSFDILRQVYVNHDNGTQKPTNDVLMQCLKEILTFSNDCPIYIIMDALDECPNNVGLPSPRESVLDLVKELVELSLPHLHICVTSRPETDIRTALEPLTSLRVSLHDETGQEKDIIDYVSSVVRSDAKMGRWCKKDQDLVIEVLTERADGMFRWVFCQLETLRHCFPSSLRQVLRGLPKSLDDTYESVLRNINETTRGHAHRLLQCLTVAVRPLRLEELAEVLAFDFDEASGGIPELNADWRREDQEQAVLSTCSSLITVVHDGDSRVVQFSHFSVKEFLMSDRLRTAVGDSSFHYIALEPAHTTLAQACLGVLLRLDDSPREVSMQRFPLAAYAAQHWVDHANFGKVSLRVNDGIDNLFDPDLPHFSQWIGVRGVDDLLKPDDDQLFEAAPVYYAALCGFPDVVEKLLREHPEFVNANGSRRGTTFHAASRRNYVDLAQSLLKHGADVNALGRCGRTPLHMASLWGNLEIGRWLLEHGADVNAKDDKRWAPLHGAANNGHLKLVRTLLRYNADVNAQTEIGFTALHLASNDGHIDVVRILLNKDADLNLRGGNDQSTPLHLALLNGELEVAQLLLERGADVDAEDDKGKTAYQIALKEGYKEIAQLLSGRAVEKKT